MTRFLWLTHWNSSLPSLYFRDTRPADSVTVTEENVTAGEKLRELLKMFRNKKEGHSLSSSFLLLRTELCSQTTRDDF